MVNPRDIAGNTERWGEGAGMLEGGALGGAGGAGGGVMRLSECCIVDALNPFP